jgi:tetratricopeptide (TPR) repeat protein
LKRYLAFASIWILLGYIVFFTASVHNAAVIARSKDITWWEYLLTEPGVILQYLRLSVWPDQLCFDYSGWPMVRTRTNILPPTLVMAFLLGATVWAWKTNSAWGFLSAWFFLILAPSSSFIPTDSPAYEHRMYLSLAAVVVLGVLGIHALVGRQTVAVALVLAIGLGVLTSRRNEDYHSDVSIWSDTVAKWPQNARAHSNLGGALGLAGRVGEAIAQCEEAVRIKPDYAAAHYNLGNALSQAGRTEEAIGSYEQAVRIKPDFAAAYCNLGNALFQAGRAGEAIGSYQQAVRIKPEYAAAHYNLGNALFQAGRIEEAIRSYQQAVRVKPDFAEAHCNLGNALGRAGKIEDAIGHYEQAKRIKPGYAEAYYNLGAALAIQGKLSEAMTEFVAALRIKPDFVAARNALTQLQARQTTP